MTRTVLTALLLTIALTFAMAGTDAMAKTNVKGAYGVIKTISDNEMVVTLYDEKKKETKDETFKLKNDTQLVIVRVADELIEGDEVQINYSGDKKNKVAEFISIMDLPVPDQAQAVAAQ